MEFTVTKVKKEQSDDRSHEHIKGVCTATGQYFSRAEVVASINDDNIWKTRAPSGHTAVIRPISYCPRPACIASPYITTRPDNQLDDNLENLPSC